MKGCELREGGLLSLKVHADWDGARADRRFNDLLRCAHLE